MQIFLSVKFATSLLAPLAERKRMSEYLQLNRGSGKRMKELRDLLIHIRYNKNTTNAAINKVMISVIFLKTTKGYRSFGMQPIWKNYHITNIFN